VGSGSPGALPLCVKAAVLDAGPSESPRRPDPDSRNPAATTDGMAIFPHRPPGAGREGGEAAELAPEVSSFGAR
jgi:hypothetical protein